MSDLYTAGGGQGLGHPLSSIRWFTGDNSVPGFTPLNLPQTPTIAPGVYGMPNIQSTTPPGIMANGLFGGDGVGGNPGAIPAIWNKIGGMEGLNSGISAFGNLANIYMGFKSLGLAKDQLDFAKSSFNKNFNAQAKSYNNELKDRWEARTAGAAARGRNYEGMNSWMEGRTIDEVGKKGG